MSFPLAHTLTRKPYTGDTEDSLGNTVPGFGASEEVRVYAISPHTVEQGTTTVTETQIADLDVFAPKIAVSLKDQFVVDSDDYEVVGVQDWTMGFHGWKPGIVIELRRVS